MLPLRYGGARATLLSRGADERPGGRAAGHRALEPEPHADGDGLRARIASPTSQRRRPAAPPAVPSPTRSRTDAHVRVPAPPDRAHNGAHGAGPKAADAW